ncbi:MAG TPA: hypothetical protein VGM11_02170 [Acidobacteriaceae bacterium]|jgi:hypothetical protein
MNQTSAVVADVQSPGIVGRAHGGQFPVVGMTISVLAMGTSGYGSTGTILSSTTTDGNGNFSLPGYTCPQSDTQVYLLGIGGNAGYGNNPSAVLAAALGGCAAAQKSYVILNEVTTAATAFAMSHFFSTTLGGSQGANDWFGGPSTTSGGTVQYSRGLVLAGTYTIPTLISPAVGAPNQTYGNTTIEWQKINTIANVLAECINTNGATRAGDACTNLFKYTQNSAGVRPTDTLQAAVQMALYPTADVAKLWALIDSRAPFVGLAAQPNDWTIGVSYTSSAVGLGVNTGTVSTLDIDGDGRIWFPSNASGKVGAAYFDPTNRTFYGPFNTTGITYPDQVAIDANGYAWYNDSASSTVAGYLVSAPTSTETVSLPNTFSNAVTIGGDDRVNVGVTNASNYRLANISADRSSYSLVPSITFTYPVASIAGDTSNGDAVATTNSVTTQLKDYYVSSAPAETDVVNSNDNSGQVIYTGNDDVGIRSYPGSGKQDGMCIYSLAKCYNFAGSNNNSNADVGIAIDGGKQLWVAESANGGVLQIPVNTAGATGGAIYLNAGGTNIPNNEFLHGDNNGSTATAPNGIGVDVSGNVWMTNAGCTGTNCTPGTFTLTEIVGAGYPTITPVSAQITSGNLVGTEPTH